MSFLQKVERCCPYVWFDCIKKMASRIKSTMPSDQNSKITGIRDLEQEQCQFYTSSKASHEDEKHEPAQSTHPDHIDHHETNLEVKINLKPTSDREEENLLKEQEQEAIPPISNFDFKLNLDPLHQFYDLIDNKTQNIGQYFDQPSNLILKKEGKSMVTIRQIQSMTGFKLLISWVLPCSYSDYLTICQRGTSQLSNLISQSKQTEVVQANLTINYLSFKKFMLLEPRFFHYLKYSNSSGKGQWQVCVSVKSRPNPDNSIKECDLFTISCFEEEKAGLVVNSYIELDLKSNIKARKVVQRVCEEVAAYYDRLWLVAKEEVSQSLA